MNETADNNFIERFAIDMFGEVSVPKEIYNSPDHFALNLTTGGETRRIKGNYNDDNSYPIYLTPHYGHIEVGDCGLSHEWMGVNRKMARNSDCGRIWHFAYDSLLIFTMWGWDNDKAEKMISGFMDEINVRPSCIIAVDGVSYEDMSYLIYDNEEATNNYEIRNNDEEKERLLALHLMNSQEKMNRTKNFRDEREQKNAEKLGGMTMAQWNDIKYGQPVAESKDRIITDKKNSTMKQRIRLTESQLRNVIANAVNEMLKEGVGDEKLSDEEKKQARRERQGYGDSRQEETRRQLNHEGSRNWGGKLKKMYDDNNRYIKKSKEKWVSESIDSKIHRIVNETLNKYL